MSFCRTLIIVSTALLLTVATGPCFGQEAAESQEEAPAVTGVALDPANPETGAAVKVNFKLNDSTVRAEVKWFVNDEEVGPGKFDGVSTHAELGQSIKEGDKVKVEIIPFDATGTEGKVASKSVTVRNAPPELELVGQKLDGQTYRAQVKSKDPQGGKITLDVQGPEGMKIDQKGNITWKLSSKTAGKFDVKVTAKNEKGAESVLTYTVGINR